MAELSLRLLDSHNKDNLFDFYTKIKDDDLLHAFFYTDTSLSNFLATFHNMWVYIPMIDGQDAGFLALNDFIGKNAFGHICMFRGFEQYAVEAVKSVLETVFKNGDLKNVLTLTPVPYRHVSNVLKQAGFQELTRLENACIVHGKYRTGIIYKINGKNFMEDLYSENL